MTRAQADALIEAVRAWVEGRGDLRALALAGSWARGDPTPSSDLDLIILAREPARYRRAAAWLSALPLAEAGFALGSWQGAEYGEAWSCHIALQPEGEIELTVASPAWANVSPLDPGTQRVVRDGFRVIVDKDGALARLCAKAGIP